MVLSTNDRTVVERITVPLPAAGVAGLFRQELLQVGEGMCAIRLCAYEACV